MRRPCVDSLQNNVFFGLKPPSTCMKMFDHAELHTKDKVYRIINRSPFKLSHLLSKWGNFRHLLVFFCCSILSVNG